MTNANVSVRAGVEPPRGRHGLLIEAMVWSMIILMIVPPGFSYGENNIESMKAGNLVTQAILLFVLSGSLLVIATRVRLTLRVAKTSNPYLWLLLFVAVLSTLWSIDPDLTGKRVFRLVTQTGLALALVVGRWDAGRFPAVMRRVFLFVLTGSIVFGLTSPELAIHKENQPELLGAWKGLTTQKNVLGALSALSFIFWFHGWMSRSVGGFKFLLGASISITCVLLSRSSTSLMATVLACLTMVLLMRAPGSLQRVMPYAVATLSAFIVIYSLAVLRVIPGLEVLLSPIPAITGKDLTFSGRSEIWAAVVQHIEMRPFLGSGFGAYWAGPFPDSESYIIKGVLRGFYPYSAHNGYLDVLNDLGVVGAVLLLAYLKRYISDSMRLYRADRRGGALFVGIFLQQALGNLSESSWFNTTKFEFVVVTMATLALGRLLLDEKKVIRPLRQA
jgi:exopolysaccharide production protein ExoQ